MQANKRLLSKSLFLTICSLLLVFVYNLRFFLEVHTVYSFQLTIILSLALLLFLIVLAFLNVICWGGFIKPIIIIILIMSSLASYFMDSYGIPIDHSMIGNVFKTDSNEAYDLLNLKFISYFIFLGIAPSVLILCINIKKVSKREEIRKALLIILSCLLIVALNLIVFGRFYSSFFREHKIIRSYTNPTYWLYSFASFTKESLRSSAVLDFKIQGKDAKVVEEPTEKLELVILVVGETARRDHFSLNGYEIKTNPLLEKEDLISFNNVISCGTSTAYSLPCMFSNLKHSGFSKVKTEHQSNILDVLKGTNFVEVLWRDNNSDSKGVADRIAFENYKTSELNTICDPECRDVGMLIDLDKFVKNSAGKDVLIVLHQMGSHGPAYFKRYPKNFEVFKPTCETNELKNCSNTEIINTYDNTILYTDHFLSQVISFLKKYDKTHETAMIYVSDHGESLGEKNIYLHGMPFSFAPKAQVEIPMIFWLGSIMKSEIRYNEFKEELNLPLSHDNLFHTLLGIYEVKTEIYDPKLDIFSKHRKSNK